jgi:hypothetical protein
VNQPVISEVPTNNVVSDDTIGLSTIAPQATMTTQQVGERLLDILDSNNPTSTLPENNPMLSSLGENVVAPASVLPAPSAVVSGPVDLPLPPPLPNHYASTISPLPDFGATVSSEPPTPPLIDNDPAQFRIPGQ